MSAQQAAAVLGATVIGDPAAMLRGVSTDSRTVAKGNLFVALKGDAFDGHDYVAKAAQSGAGAALVSRRLAGAAIPLIVVDDTLVALGKLGRAHRDAIKAPFVGITGSAGKSTAKEMTAAVLAWGNRKVLKTEGNLNNRIGVPLTVMSATPEHAACVIEMGISFPDEMPELVKIAAPDVRVVLNAGSSHLEFLKSPEGVAKEKARLWDDAHPADTMIFNADDPLVAAQAKARTNPKRISFGKNGADVKVLDAKATGVGATELAMDVRGTSLRVTLAIYGAHHVTNAAAATAIGLALGVPADEIKRGLETRFQPMPGRGDIRRLKGGVTLIDDSYNSNPTSATASLRALGEARGAGARRAFAALGDMLELGDTAEREHRGVGESAAAAGVDRLFLFGPNARHTADGAAKHSTPAEAKVYATRPELAEALLAALQPGDVVLVKGSRGMKMNEVVDLVVAAKGVA